MRKLILKMSTSLNGFVCGPNGELDWMLAGDGGGSKAWQLARAWEAGLHIMGRKSFNDMKGFWPFSDDDYAKPMNAIPKACFSRHGPTDGGTRAPEDARRAGGEAEARNEGAVESWNAAPCLTGDLAEEIRTLKEANGKPIIAWGGAGFARSLIPTGLIDEYQFLVHPVAIPAGLEIFSGLDAPLRLMLAGLERFDNGVVAKVLHPA
ncbi:MAG TPA: dihydrofolate reductase family protein [Allosphingosinicella sp.]|jgi:dihydrofolate reductase